MVLGPEDIPYGCFVFFGDILPVIMMIPTLIVLLPMYILLFPLVLPYVRHLRIGSIPKEAELQGKLLKGLKFAHFSVREVFRMKPTQRDTDELPQTEFFGYVAPRLFILQASNIAVSLAGYAAFVFTKVFFVKESYQCDAENSDLVCFTTNASNTRKRVNCSTINSTFDGTMPALECYEFVFQTSDALSAAGGILTMGGVAFLSIATCILFTSKGKENWNRRK